MGKYKQYKWGIGKKSTRATQIFGPKMTLNHLEIALVSAPSQIFSIHSRTASGALVGGTRRGRAGQGMGLLFLLAKMNDAPVDDVLVLSARNKVHSRACSISVCRITQNRMLC